MTATAPAFSAIFACSASTTSMMTPPLSISARPVLTRRVPVSLTLLSVVVAILRVRRASVVGDRRIAPAWSNIAVDPVTTAATGRTPCRSTGPWTRPLLGGLRHDGNGDGVGLRGARLHLRRGHAARRILRRAGANVVLTRTSTPAGARASPSVQRSATGRTPTRPSRSTPTAARRRAAASTSSTRRRSAG